MTAPIAVRDVAAAAGALLVLSTVISVVGTVIVPRKSGSRLTRMVASTVNRIFGLIIWPVASYRWRDRIMAGQAAVILLGQLAVWLGSFYLGYALLIWPATGSIGTAFTSVGAALWTFGSAEAHGFFATAVLDAAAMAGLITVTLQIAYLPTLYAAFNRRETEVALLNARAGIPSWGPELLARTHYALGSGVSTIDTMPDLYAQWERLAADIAESHTTYLPLVRFRSPQPLSSWVTALLAVLDSAALFLALSPNDAPEVPARLCLRSGFLCFARTARAMGLPVPDETGPPAAISLSYEDFLDGVAVMRKVGFPTERAPEEAWPDFVGWRVNYEQAAYGLAFAVDAPPAKWSGPRRYSTKPIPPIRPPYGRPDGRLPAGRHGPPRAGRTADEADAKARSD